MSASTVKFSFIVPVYNVEKYLSRCLDSLLSQNYQNYEIICVNDGSPDNSVDILQAYQEKHDNISVINQENKGRGGARNTGLQYASGDYIWFVDSDDWIEPDALYLLNDFIIKKGFKDMILFDAYRKQQQKSVGTLMRASKKKVFENGVDYARCLLDGDGLMYAWIKICKRVLFEQSSFQFSKGFYEDISEIPFYANYVHTIGYLDKPLYDYFVNDSSIMHTYDRRIFDALYQLANLKNALSPNKELKSDLLYYEVRETYNTNRRIRYAKENLKKDFLKQVKQLNLCKLNNTVFIWNGRIGVKKRIKMFFYNLVYNIESSFFQVRRS